MLRAADERAVDSQVFIALDVETTGLDRASDEIIEIAIVRFTRQEVLDSWSTLVRPSRMPGPEIVRLTGIHPEQLVDAPPFGAVRETVREKLGAHPIVGHSVDFDLDMLGSAGLRVANRPLDTYRLSSLFLYGLPAYSLTAVADALDVRVDEVHRALADAETARRIFLTILPLMQRYSTTTLMHAARYARSAGWQESWLMQLVAEDDTLSPVFRTQADLPWLEPAETRFLARLQRPESLKKTGVTTPVNPDDVERALTPGGALGTVLDHFETRPAQIQMATAVTEVLNRDGELLVEAGTGTGKSMAYLLPAALHAINRGERVVISTDTRALQEQLYQKDVPDVQTAVERLGIPEGVRASVLKGRNNYICLRRWFSHDRRETADANDASMRAKVALWLDETESGDHAELRLSPDELAHWRQVAAEEEACVASQCPFNQKNQCFLYRARRNAEHAHLVVANHSLLLADTDHRVLPDFDRLIIDEAHHLEEEATRHFGYVLEQRLVETLLDNLLQGRRAGQRGALDQAQSFLSGSPEPSARKAAPEARKRVQQAGTIRARVLALNTELFTRVDRMLKDQRSAGNYGAALRVTEATRSRQDWLELEQIWEQLDRGLFDYESLITWLLNELERLPAPKEAADDPQSLVREELWLELMSRWRELHEFRLRLTSAVAEPGEDTIYWLEQVGYQRHPTIQAAPLFVDELLQQKLFKDMRTVVATSATLTIDGSFDFLAGRIGMREANSVALGSPFDHRESTLLLLPDDMPLPSDGGYQQALNDSIVRLCTASEGRALVLFTSYAALRAAYEPVKAALTRQNIAVYAQGMDGGAKALIDRLKVVERSVVFGTASFWEGIDVPGDALSMLIITKLPFPVPSDPIFQARGELLENEFMELAVPSAVLRFKQGFGRLIRRSTDRGVCAVLDRRVIAKRYGVHFLHSLPPTTQRVTSRHEMGTLAGMWLDNRPLPSVPDFLNDEFDAYEGVWR
jgi:DNA polymerase-3 subunit epsilon/ATP-dependent DNA helicase DinG